MQAFSVMSKPSPVFPGRDADKLGENAGVVVGIIKAYVKGNIPNGNIRFHQEIFGGLNAYLINIGIDVYLDPPLKNMA